MEELQKQIIAIQLIQELIVDMCDEFGIFKRTEFENRLNSRVDDLNKQMAQLNTNLNKTETKPILILTSVLGEA
jgi:polyhydroxyalkanoate synthesis regulator phasin